MANVVQIRRGTTAEVAALALLAGELAVDTDKDILCVGTGGGAGTHVEMLPNASVAAAVNTLSITQSATLDPVLIAATGTDTDIDINITPKGAGTVNIGGQPVLSSTITTPADGDILEYDTGEFINTTPKEVIIVACSDETTALTTGTAKVTFRMPFAMTLSAVRASLTGAGSTSGTTTVDINDGGTTILSTKLTIDATELTSTTAATAAVISDTALADDAQITIDIDAVTGGADETGLKVYLIGRRT